MYLSVLVENGLVEFENGRQVNKTISTALQLKPDWRLECLGIGRKITIL
jgi:hypothetical protein